MGRIRILDNHLVNKIAAGEVVERPASVVRELLENALDAGATHIAVEIEDGGRRLIRVVDDGRGMDAEDLRLAVVPHATSKLSREEDLYAIGTLGFRGEALASIGSVARLRLASRPANSDAGHVIEVEGGRIGPLDVIGCAAGTCVEVRQLFFNVPARAKFLRAATTEMGHITEQLSRTALGHRHIGFSLSHNGRSTMRLLPTDDLRQRIAGLMSQELADELIPLARDERGIRIEGLLASPARARSSGRWQYVLLNGRYIRDRFIQHAITEAHRGLVDARNQPVVILLITMDPSSVDVNVHPTKIEVRWRDSGLIHSQVLAVLRDALLSSDLSGRLTFSGDHSSPASDAQREAIRQEMADYFRTAELTRPAPPDESIAFPSPPPPHSGNDRPGSGAAGDRGWNAARERDRRASRPAADLYAPIDALADPGSTATPGHAPVQPTSEAPAEAQARLRAIQLHNTYLVAETEDGLMIIDQHALHERVLYNELKERLTAGALESQRLLLPETVETNESQMDRLEAHADLLKQLGFDLAPFGPRTVAVHAVPTLLPDAMVCDFFASLLDHLCDLPAGAQAEEVLHTILDTMACKAAVKAGDHLSDSEIQALLAKSATAEKASNCPHGRPTTLRLSVRDLERQFHRT